MRVPRADEDTGFGERSFCAFCAAPSPASGTPCCDEAAARRAADPDDGAEFDELGVDIDWPPAPAAVSSRPRFVVGSQFLVGLLVSCVGVLALALTYQAKLASERARELEATRRLSEEMIALMKEARRGEPPAAAVEPAPAAEAEPGAETAPPKALVTADADENAPLTPTESASGPQETADSADGGVTTLAEAAAVDRSTAAPPASSSFDTAAIAVPSAPAPLEAIDAGAARKALPPAGEAPKTATVAKPEPPRAAGPPAAPAVGAPSTSPPASGAVTEAPVTKPAPPSATAPGVAAKTVVAATSRPVAAKPLEKAARAAEPAAETGTAVQEPKPAKAEPESPARIADGGELAPAEPRAPESRATLPELAARTLAERRSPAPPRPKITAWTELERGMSRGEVRALLGEPRWVERLLAGEFWLYADRSIMGRGWVAFSAGGDVIEWLEP